MALMKYRKGTAEFDSGIAGGTGYREGHSPYASFPTPGDAEGKGFQSQPFGGPQQQPVTTEYNVPSY